MKKTAIIINVAFIITSVYFLLKNPPGRDPSLDIILWITLFFAAPISSLLVFAGACHAESWLILILQRKKLEEQNRIDQIKDRGLRPTE